MNRNYALPLDKGGKNIDSSLYSSSVSLFPFPMQELLQKLRDLQSAVSTGKDSL